LKPLFEADPGLRERWRVVDVGDAHALRGALDAIRPVRVFHLAALLSATGERDPGRCWRVNVESLRTVLDHAAGAKGADGRRASVVWPSSIAAFGPIPGVEGGYPGGVAENETSLHPRTMYGVTKAAGELLGDWYARTGRVDFRCVRFPGLLNETEPGGGSSDYANMMYFAAARGEPSVEVFVNERARIPFMYMPDAVRALVDLAEAPVGRLTRTVYNVAAFSPSAREIEESIRRVLGSKDFRVVYATKPDPRQDFVDSWPDVLDDTPAREDWGWKPSWDLDGMSRELIGIIAGLSGHG
jgi:threonine 3-dehydrogenase